MARHGIQGFIALAGLSATSLYAAQPPNPSSVLTDDYYDTAMGLGALSSDVTPQKRCIPPMVTGRSSSYYMSGCANTASGFFALNRNTIGAGNTAMGAGALYLNTVGNSNTAAGALAMLSNTTGFGDVATGFGALYQNTTGFNNVATGFGALSLNTTGIENIATGAFALGSNTTGGANIATGYAALGLNTTGHGNTATGSEALFYNMTGNANVATGELAQFYNLTGSSNVAVGYTALYVNEVGSDNVAIGTTALFHSYGADNVAVGLNALSSLTTGDSNVAVGPNTGAALLDGSFNTYIGFGANAISAADNYVTVIGSTGIKTATTYIAGIGNSPITGGLSVVVNPSTGQVGYAASSERYKTDIASLGADTDRLAQLRPVRFHVRIDPNGSIQYGLIAEEVDRVYPELVIHDNDGKIQGVRYDELAPMLLNEVQKDHEHALTQDAIIATQAAKIVSLEQRVSKVNDLEHELAEMRTAITVLQSKNQLVAQR
jgi:hypothetical protein